MKKIYNRIVWQDDDNSINSTVNEERTEERDEVTVEFEKAFADLYTEEKEEVIKEEKVDLEIEKDDGIKEEKDEKEPDKKDSEVLEVVLESTKPIVEEVEKVDEITELKARIAKLTATIESLSSGSSTSVSTPVQVKDIPSSTTPKTTTPIDINEIFKDIDFEQVVESKEGFFDFMGKVLALAEERAKSSIMQTMPGIVDSVVTSKKSMDEIRDNFYKENPDLVAVKSYVGKVADQMSINDPTKSLATILEELPGIVRDNLGIKHIVDTGGNEEITSNLKPKPTLPGAQGAPRVKSRKVSSLQEEIDDFLNDKEF